MWESFKYPDLVGWKPPNAPLRHLVAAHHRDGSCWELAAIHYKSAFPWSWYVILDCFCVARNVSINSTVGQSIIWPDYIGPTLPTVEMCRAFIMDFQAISTLLPYASRACYWTLDNNCPGADARYVPDTLAYDAYTYKLYNSVYERQYTVIRSNIDDIWSTYVWLDFHFIIPNIWTNVSVRQSIILPDYVGPTLPMVKICWAFTTDFQAISNPLSYASRACCGTLDNNCPGADARYVPGMLAYDAYIYKLRNSVYERQCTAIWSNIDRIRQWHTK